MRPNVWLDARASEDGRCCHGAERTGVKAVCFQIGGVQPRPSIRSRLHRGQLCGRPLVGTVTDVLRDDCAVVTLDFWRGSTIERNVPRMLVSQILVKADACMNSSFCEVRLGADCHVVSLCECLFVCILQWRLVRCTS